MSLKQNNKKDTVSTERSEFFSQILMALTSSSDVGERGGGEEAHSEHARDVVVLAAALVAEVKRMLLLPLVRLAEQDHLSQESVHDNVLVVDLSAAHRKRTSVRNGKRMGSEKNRRK